MRYVMSYLDEFSRFILLEPLPSKHAIGVMKNIFLNNRLYYYYF